MTLAGVKFVFSGKADKKIKPGKILIIQTSKIGDMVCTTPMFRAVKGEYPESRLYVMGNEINKELLAGNPDIDSYLVCQKNIRVRDLFKVIKAENFDFAAITAPNFTALAVLYLAGVPLIAAPIIKNGFSPYFTKSYRILTNFVATQPHRMGNYAPREYLRLLEPIGIFSENTKKYLYYSEETEKKISSFFQKNNLLLGDFVAGIAPSAGNKIKRWGRDKFAKIADYLFEKYQAKILILGSENDRPEATEMISCLSQRTNIIDTVGLFNIEELKALISKLNIVIAVDSGVIYIAEAFGVPTIDIVGPIDEREQPPIDGFHRVVVPQRDKPELYVMNARVYDEKEARRQAESITVETVIRELDDLMKTIRN